MCGPTLFVRFVLLGVFISFFTPRVIPDGHIGVFVYPKNNNTALTEILQAGRHMVSMWQKAKLVSVSEQERRVTGLTCRLINGTTVPLQDIVVQYKLRTDSVVDVIDRYTVDYARALIDLPVYTLVQDWCALRSWQKVENGWSEQLPAFLEESFTPPQLTVSCLKTMNTAPAATFSIVSFHCFLLLGVLVCSRTRRVFIRYRDLEN